MGLRFSVSNLPFFSYPEYTPYSGVDVKSISSSAKRISKYMFHCLANTDRRTFANPIANGPSQTSQILTFFPREVISFAILRAIFLSDFRSNFTRKKKKGESGYVRTV